MSWNARDALTSLFVLIKTSRAKYLIAALVAGVMTTIMMGGTESPTAQPGGVVNPTLSVALTVPQRVEWPQELGAFGNIAAWQEAVIGAEIGDFRLTEVRVNIGDAVKKGQVLATIADDTVAVELAQAKALAAEAEAMLAEARANADRARQIGASGALSAQHITQYLTAEQTALARLNAANARVEADTLRLSKTRVIAPDDGVISARAANVGSLAQPGQELFRLIIDNRLEWRAEVTAEEAGRLKPGVAASITTADGARIRGKVRMVAPTVDPKTRNAIVYVDLPIGCAARAGMFVRGEFALGNRTGLALPQSAVLLRDGFAYVFAVSGSPADQYRVTQVKVGTGRRVGDQIEITGNLAPDAEVAASGAGFLSDGDVVRVVNEPVLEQAANAREVAQ